MRLRILTCAAVVVASLLTADAGAPLDLPRASQKATVSQTVGFTTITVTYGRPGVRGRKIWGDLIAYDQVWRTGANESTTITVDADVMIESQKLSAGTYSIHTIPSREEWTIIFNRAVTEGGSFEYDAAQDVLRVRVRPQSAEHQEWLLFMFPQATASETQLVLHWEKMRVPLRIEAGTVQQALENIRKALAAAKPDDWQTRYRAADYALQNEVAMAEAAAWLDESIAIRPVYYNLALKARLLARLGDRAKAIATAERALEMATDSTDGRRVDATDLQTFLAQLKLKSDP